MGTVAGYAAAVRVEAATGVATIRGKAAAEEVGAGGEIWGGHHRSVTRDCRRARRSGYEDLLLRTSSSTITTTESSSARGLLVGGRSPQRSEMSIVLLLGGPGSGRSA